MTGAARIRNVGLFTMPRTMRRPAVVGGGRVADDLAHRRTIVVIEPAAERVGQQLFGHRAREPIGRIEQQRAQARQPVDRGAAHRAAAGVHRLPRFVDGPPAANRVEVLEREAERIDHRVAAAAHRIAAMLGQPFADGRRRRSRLRFRQTRVDAGRRRRHGHAEDVVEQPFAAQHRRRAIRIGGRGQQRAVAPAARRADRGRAA